MDGSSLTWYSTKQSTLKKSISLNYAANNLDVINIPVKYICLGSKNILFPKRNFLIQSDKVLFEYYNSSSSSITTNHEYSFNEISSFQYAEKNCLIRLKMVKNNRFPETDEPLFNNIAWFCLDYKTYGDYSKLLESLLKIEINISPISYELLHHFQRIMYKCDDSYDRIEFVNDWEKCLLIETVSNNNDIMTNKINKRKSEDLQTGSEINKHEEKYVYCPSPSHSIEISSADLLCLCPQYFINDNIINLYITYIFHEIINEQQRKRAHFFNCFFNTKLAGSNKHSVSEDTPEIRHKRVAKWTKNVDIFDKDFLVIPVIESQHWFLVIVCFPWMAGIVDYSELLGKSEPGSISNIPDNQSEFVTKGRYERLAEMKANDPKLDPLPCILIFDSLSSESRAEKVNIIRDYLKSEWDIKRLPKDGPLIFDKTTVRGFSLQTPQQKYLTDCGVYLLHYLETFFKEPLKTYTVQFFQSTLFTWLSQEDLDKKRSSIKSIIERVIIKSVSFPSNSV